MPAARTNPADYQLLIKGMVGSDSPIARTRDRLQGSYAYLARGQSLSGDSDLETTDDMEIDIIRFQFTKLKPYHTDPTISTMKGEYNIMIQDLNAGNMVSTSFAYEEICQRPSDSRVDSYSQTFKAGVGHDCSHNQNVALNEVYKSEASKIASISDGVATGGATADYMKLLATRNYFNYVILGHDDPSSSSRISHKGLLIWSMDLAEDQFSRAAGLIQTGFGGIDIADAAVEGGLKADDKMLHVVELPDSVNEEGSFIVGDDINATSAAYTIKLKSNASAWG